MTKRSLLAIAFPIAAALALTGCEAKKSSNPLSPDIAGPIPGVEITQPKLLEPGQGRKYRDKDLPLTLLIENASSNGPRPLVYAFEIAVDAGFQNIIFSRRGVPQGPNGRTELKMQDKLQLGRNYYWRAWAYDGANTGQVARSLTFEVFPPVVIHSPDLRSPGNGAIVTSLAPQLRVRNSFRSGPAGNVRYHYQFSHDQAFSQIVSAGMQPENIPAGETIWAPAGLTFGQTYYWRVQATDGEVTSGFSPTWSLSTASAPAPGPSGPGGAICGPPPPGTPLGIVTCERSKYGTPLSSGQFVSFLRGVATNLNAAGVPGGRWGILRKTSGHNCGGYSCDIICNAGGQQFDVLGDQDNAAYPQWGQVLNPNPQQGCELQ